jgi:hypothetical protein
VDVHDGQVTFTKAPGVTVTEDVMDLVKA